MLPPRNLAPPPPTDLTPQQSRTEQSPMGVATRPRAPAVVQVSRRVARKAPIREVISPQRRVQILGCQSPTSRHLAPEQGQQVDQGVTTNTKLRTRIAALILEARVTEVAMETAVTVARGDQVHPASDPCLM